MSEVMCCPLIGNDGEPPSVYRTETRRARKQYWCEECGEDIKAGDRYEYTSVLGSGGHWWTARTCLSCVEIRNHFACNGWTSGQVWSDLQENFFPNMKAGGPCMQGLSPAAKDRLFTLRTKWLLNRSR